MSVEGISVTCFRPIITINPKYRKLSSHDKKMCQAFYEDFYLRVPCGKCYLCRKRKANSWRVRLIEELKSTSKFYDEYQGLVYRAIFLLFTFSDKYVTDDRKKIAGYIRKWRDLWRKHYGKSPRYFITTDKGSQFGRVHLHLILFSPYDYKRGKYLTIEDLDLFDFFWRFGFVGRRKSYVDSMRAATYITLYLTGSVLSDEDEFGVPMKHDAPVCKEALEYIPHIFVSNGLGKSFLVNARFCHDKELQTYNINGYEYALPLYYRNKIYDYEERWYMNKIHKLEQQQYVLDRLHKGYDDVEYLFNCKLYNKDSIEELYFSVYSRYDKEPNIKL